MFEASTLSSSRLLYAAPHEVLSILELSLQVPVTVTRYATRQIAQPDL